MHKDIQQRRCYFACRVCPPPSSSYTYLYSVDMLAQGIKVSFHLLGQNTLKLPQVVSSCSRHATGCSPQAHSKLHVLVVVLLQQQSYWIQQWSLGTFLVSRKLVGSMTQTQGKGFW